MVSPGNTEPSIRKVIRRKRPCGPVQSVMKRSNQAAWLGVLRKMSWVPLRFDGEVLVVVHRPPVPGGQGTQHHGGGGDRIGELGKLVAGVRRRPASVTA